jgi:hypothetical protein
MTWTPATIEDVLEGRVEVVGVRLRLSNAESGVRVMGRCTKLEGDWTAHGQRVPVFSIDPEDETTPAGRWALWPEGSSPEFATRLAVEMLP